MHLEAEVDIIQCFFLSFNWHFLLTLNFFHHTQNFTSNNRINQSNSPRSTKS